MKKFLVVLLFVFSLVSAQTDVAVTQSRKYWGSSSGRWHESSILPWINPVSTTESIVYYTALDSAYSSNSLICGPLYSWPFMSFCVEVGDSCAAPADSIDIDKVSLFQWCDNSFAKASYIMDLEWKSPTTKTGTVALIDTLGYYSCNPSDVDTYLPAMYTWLVFDVGSKVKIKDGNWITVHYTGWGQTAETIGPRP